MSATEETRIEWSGTLEVHYPIKPSVHALLTETSVMCA